MSKTIKPKFRCPRCRKANRVFNKQDVCNKCTERGGDERAFYRKIMYGIGRNETGHYELDNIMRGRY